MRRLLTLPVFLLLAASSGATTQTIPLQAVGKDMAPRRALPAIAGGSPTTDYPYMVRLEGRYKDGIQPFCSGSLIAPRYVLTAAHCIGLVTYAKAPLALPIESPEQVRKAELQVRFSQVPGAPSIAAARAAMWGNWHPQFLGSNPTSDLALVELVSDAPVDPVPLGSTEGKLVFHAARILGYGPTAPGQGMQQQLFQAPTTPTAGSACSHPSDELMAFEETEICSFFNDTSGGGVCHGDSGGALISEATEPAQLIGVTSWMPQDNCKPETEQRESVFARADAADGWLERQTGLDLFDTGQVFTQNLQAPRVRLSSKLNRRRLVVATKISDSSGEPVSGQLTIILTGKSRGKTLTVGGFVDGYDTTQKGTIAIPAPLRRRSVHKVKILVVVRVTNGLHNGGNAVIMRTLRK